MTSVVSLSKLSAAAGWALLLVAVIEAGRALQRADPLPPTRIGVRWWALLALALLCFRWPLLWVPHQQNPDESQLIAGAITLSHDPVFWRSVDGGTAGPLDFYPLLPVAWSEGVTSYAIARLIAIVVVFGTIVFAGQTVALVAGAAVARLTVLPAIAFYALTTNPDFHHYSTELMPGLLLAAAAYVAVRHLRVPASGTLWLFAFLTGSVLWTKLQAVPLAIALWGVVAGREIYLRRSASWLPLIVGAFLPSLIFLAMATLAGEIENLVVPYFVQNVAYVKAPQFTWFGVAVAQWNNALIDGYLASWLVGAAVAVAFVGIAAFRNAPAAARGYLLAAGLLAAAGVFSTLGPRRPSAHHLYLLVVPLLWLTGAALALAFAHPRLQARAKLVGLLFSAMCLLPQLASRALAHDPFAPINALGQSEERRALANLVGALASRDEPIAMWGWRCSLYVEAARRQATRQAHTEAQIYESKLQPYFLQRYLADFEASNPPVFADAVGPGNFAFESPRFAHEVFRPLREIVQSRYTLVTTLDGTRVYARNDRLPRLKGTLPGAAGE